MTEQTHAWRDPDPGDWPAIPPRPEPPRFDQGVVGIGDGPAIPCRVVAMDLGPSLGGPLVSGVREADGTFRLDRVALPVRHVEIQLEPRTAVGYVQLTPEETRRWLEAYERVTHQVDALGYALSTVARRATEAADEFMRRTLTGEFAPDDERGEDWAAESAVCCHVCGPDPGHCCDARATTSITHPLPSGGTRTLPLCGPCRQAETAAATVAS